jgi:hypothetical protein
MMRVVRISLGFRMVDALVAGPDSFVTISAMLRRKLIHSQEQKVNGSHIASASNPSGRA